MIWILLSLQSLLNPSFISFSEIAVPEPEPQSVVVWLTEQDHDFGELRQGKPASFVFQFKNALSDTIVLQTVRTTCGCTAARYTEEPIPPGATGEITVEYDAYQSGAFSKKIRVFFDKQKKAEILWVRGVVE